MTATATRGHGDVEGYELLRQRALSGDAAGWRLGLAVLRAPRGGRVAACPAHGACPGTCPARAWPRQHRRQPPAVPTSWSASLPPWRSASSPGG